MLWLFYTKAQYSGIKTGKTRYLQSPEDITEPGSHAVSNLS